MDDPLPPRPLAFLYHWQPSGEPCSSREAGLARCRERAEILHWDVAGEWHDEAASPPDMLPGLRRLLELMRRHDHSRGVVCLVESAERLGPTLAVQAEVRRAVAYAGGTVETAGGTVARRSSYPTVERA
jgi:hypothetical protein